MPGAITLLNTYYVYVIVDFYVTCFSSLYTLDLLTTSPICDLCALFNESWPIMFLFERKQYLLLLLLFGKFFVVSVILLLLSKFILFW